MSACQCERIESKFDEAYATEKLESYRKRGPDASTVALIEAVLEEGVEGMTLLDIGGGVGAVQHALLAAGVTTAQDVEASPAYLAACRAEAERRGHADRITHLLGDFSSLDDQVEPADVVTLDRSMCCWPEMPDLVTRSAGKARQLYALVYPRDVWWVRYGWRIFSDVRQLIKRSPLRVFIHRTRDVEAILADAGLVRHSYREVGVWQVVVYRREAGVPATPSASRTAPSRIAPAAVSQERLARGERKKFKLGSDVRVSPIAMHSAPSPSTDHRGEPGLLDVSGWLLVPDRAPRHRP